MDQRPVLLKLIIHRMLIKKYEYSYYNKKLKAEWLNLGNKARIYPIFLIPTPPLFLSRTFPSFFFFFPRENRWWKFGTTTYKRPWPQTKKGLSDNFCPWEVPSNRLFAKTGSSPSPGSSSTDRMNTEQGNSSIRWKVRTNQWLSSFLPFFLNHKTLSTNAWDLRWKSNI